MAIDLKKAMDQAKKMDKSKNLMENCHLFSQLDDKTIKITFELFSKYDQFLLQTRKRISSGETADISAKQSELKAKIDIAVELAKKIVSTAGERQ